MLGEIARLFVTIGANIGEFKQGMKDVQKNLQDTGKKFTDIGKQMSLKVTAPIMAIGGGIAKAAMDLEAAGAKYETVFVGMTDQADAFISKFKELTPATKAEARGMASGIQDLLVPMGFVREEATNMTGEFFHVIGALANFNSGTHTTAQVAAAMQSAITGEYQSLKALGIQLDATTVQEKALEMGLISSKDEMNKNVAAQVLLAEVYAQSGDALNAYTEENLDAKTKMGLMKAELIDVAAEFGETLLPIINNVTSALRRAVEWFSGLSEEQKKTILVVSGLVAAIGPVLLVAGSLIGAVGNIIGVMKSVIPIIGLVGKAISFLGANPIMLLIAAVIGLAYLIYKNWDEIKAWTIATWDKIKAFFSQTWENIRTIFSNALSAIKTAILNIMDNIRNTILNIWNNIKSFLSNTINTIYSNTVGRFSNLVSSIRSILSGVTNAITEPFRRAWQEVSRIADNIKDALNKINPFARFSPSLVDQVQTGVKLIASEYAKLGDLDLPRPDVHLPGVQLTAAGASPVSTSTNTISLEGMFAGANINVRNDNDIKALAREIYDLFQTRSRGLGVTG